MLNLFREILTPFIDDEPPPSKPEDPPSATGLVSAEIEEKIVNAPGNLAEQLKRGLQAAGLYWGKDQ